LKDDFDLLIFKICYKFKKNDVIKSMGSEQPQLNQWYQIDDTEICFEVISLQEEFMIVQFPNGTIEEYSLEAWEEMCVMPLTSYDPWALSLPEALWQQPEEEEYKSEYDTVIKDFPEDLIPSDFSDINDY
jgi:hypothetical protein